MIIHWFRRDLRVQDNAALAQALQAAKETGAGVRGLFIFDTCILSKLEDADDARVSFIHAQVQRLQSEFKQAGGELEVYFGEPLQVWQRLAEKYADTLKIATFNRDYEPSARERDASVQDFLASKGIKTLTEKDHIIFEKLEICKDDGKPYTIFTPYSKRWLQRLEAMGAAEAFKEAPSEALFAQFLAPARELCELPSLESMGFRQSAISLPSERVEDSVLQHYGERRDFPYLQKGTSLLGLHLRFGTISIRQLARRAHNLGANVYLNELIWRDFYAMILWNFPHVAQAPFRKEYEKIAWRDAPEELLAWQEGRTGYALVDAGMRQLNATGYMHNRVRMLVASFLSKHLLINWQEGERYFARKLLDFDQSSNSGGWQWAAGCGTDAAPYFRIFSPAAQQKKFDPQGEYIRRWVKDFDTLHYPRPLVEHEHARKRCLDAYSVVSSKQ